MIRMMAGVFAVAVFAVVGIAQEPASSPATRPAMKLEAEAFAAEIGKPGHVVIDVRTPTENAAGHISGTDRLIDFEAPDFSSKIAELPKDQTYLIYCRSGRRSGLAADQMAGLGLQVKDLKGGVIAWEKAGRPLVK